MSNKSIISKLNTPAALYKVAEVTKVAEDLIGYLIKLDFSQTKEHLLIQILIQIVLPVRHFSQSHVFEREGGKY